MRYQNPSIASVIEKIREDGIDEVLLFPQYPHYAMSSWETVVVKVYEEVARLAPKLKIDCVQPFYQDHDYIEALLRRSARSHSVFLSRHPRASFAQGRRLQRTLSHRAQLLRNLQCGPQYVLPGSGDENHGSTRQTGPAAR